MDTLPIGTEESIDLAETKFSQIILEGGWQLQKLTQTNTSEHPDGTLLHCSYRGVKCDQRVSRKHSYFGSCPLVDGIRLLSQVPT